jgi:hypothetical protein
MATRTVSIVPETPVKDAPFANATHAFFGPTRSEVTLTFMRIPPEIGKDMSQITEWKVPVVQGVTVTVDVAAGLARSILENLPRELRDEVLDTIGKTGRAEGT